MSDFPNPPSTGWATVIDWTPSAIAAPIADVAPLPGEFVWGRNRPEPGETYFWSRGHTYGPFYLNEQQLATLRRFTNPYNGGAA
jgi:hypothetical protein